VLLRLLSARGFTIARRFSFTLAGMSSGDQYGENPMPEQTETVRLNSLNDLVEGVFCGISGAGPDTVSLPFTLGAANNYIPLTLNRILLSYSFMTQGLIQTVIKQPVDDAFRGGVTFSSSELDEDDLKLLNNSIKKPRRMEWKNRRDRLATKKLNPTAAVNLGNSDLMVVKDVLNWSRLFGGAGLVINTDQDFKSELDPEQITEESPLEFLAADRWELILQAFLNDLDNPTPYNFYGLPLHRSRVVKVSGVEAPSFIRTQLQGWGMSEIERCIRPINSFVKFENLIFELLDEAKIDVYKIQGFNDALLTDDGTANTQKRILLSNRLKSFQNALAMDAEDDYAQKQITWSGLAEIWNQLRINLSSALRIPMNKLFGESATGFGGGEDALENYNAMVEGVRSDSVPVLLEVGDLRCQQLFGFVPEDLAPVFKPLKVMSGEEEEKVKTSKQARTMDLFVNRLTTGRETSQILRSDNLLEIETEVSKGLRDVEPTMPNSGDPSDKQIEADAANAKAKAKPPAAKGKK
jgi:phage-related protein (TIGR01555 family)